MTAGAEPVVGWRLWQLDRGRLRSRDGEYEWQPGPNRALCTAKTGTRCATAPGPGCHCGFWALWRPRSCVEHAAELSLGASGVLGLIAGWGDVALHGGEGFRAQLARPVALFSDWPWNEPALSRGLRRMLEWLATLVPGVHAPGAAGPATVRGRGLELAAALYQVPVVSLAEASRLGLLGEMGVGDGARKEVDALLA